MTKTWGLRLALIAALVSIAACSGGADNAAGSPASTTVRTFYDHLNAGRYDQAKELYTEATRQEIFFDESAEEGFRDWALLETHEGGLTGFEVVEEIETEDGITIQFQLRFSDGATVQREVTVTDEAGAWRLGFIS